MDEPGGLGGVATQLGMRVHAFWMAFRSLPAPAQIASVAASGLLVGAMLLAVALWPFGSSHAAKPAVAGGADGPNATPTLMATVGSYGGGSWTGGGPIGGPGNPATGTPSTSETPGPGTPSVLTVVITQVAVNVTSAELSVRTAPSASVTAAVTYTSAQVPDTSSGLSGARTADSNGNYTWTWTPVGAVPSQGGEACVSVQVGTHSTGACQSFTTTTQPLPTLVPTALPSPLPSVPPLPTVVLPTVTIPTITVPTETVTVPSILPSVSPGLPGPVQTMLPTTTLTLPILTEVRPAPHEDI